VGSSPTSSMFINGFCIDTQQRMAARDTGLSMLCRLALDSVNCLMLALVQNGHTGD
jgi:hypothetical protein